MTIQTKATEQYFPVVLFIMLYKVVLPFRSVEEILKCDKFVLTFEMKVIAKSVKYDRQGEVWS